ncbi:MAG: ATP-binding protein [FCB group bacterium]|jgi:PAS domain S-box-containing protein|nr:ATP-binding protein [FCB group bacterium]
MQIAESILRTLTEPVLVLDETFRAIMANPAFYQTLQITPGELEGKQVQKLIAGENGNPHLRTVLEPALVRDGNVEGLEVVCALPSRERAILMLNARRVPIEEGLSEMILVELRDVTEDRETESHIQVLNNALQEHATNLEAMNVELEAFTHSVSHDLRTPLRLTNKIAHLLLQEHGTRLPPDAVDKVNMILDSTREMAKLLEDLLTFSRVSREPMKKRRVDLARLVREALHDLRDEHPDRNVEIVVAELGTCQADRALLKQVFLNLLANAFKFTRPREKATIDVGSQVIDGETVYFVRDNGVGFNMAHYDSLFIPFHRLHKQGDFEGSGVGLALVRRVVERHCGRVWAEGEVDGGAVFYFTLGS